MNRGALASLLLLALAAGPGAAVPAAAQGAGSAVLRGEVRDPTGSPVAGVDVVLRDGADRPVAGTATDGEGRYVLVGLDPGGPYALVAERIGYATVRRDRIQLEAGESRRLDVVLRQQPLDLPAVEVSVAADPVFSGTRTGASTVIEERAVETAPTVERNLVALAALSPMASLEADAVSVAGQNSRFNSLRVDGALSQDVFGLSPSGVPGGRAGARPLPLRAVHQYAVVVAPYDVRQSGFTGGLLNAVTRSGGDAWEGTAFAYYRDAAFSRTADDSEVVRTYGRGAAAEFRTESAGFAAGGPVGRARVFVAGEAERRRRPLPGFHVGGADPLRVGLSMDSVERMRQLLRDLYGFDAGTADAYPLENPLGNLFARLDVPLGRHDLTVRYNGILAEEDVAANHLGFDAYGLSSTGQRIESRTHGVMARVASRLDGRTTNELLLNVQHTADRTTGSPQPLVEVRVQAVYDTLLMSRRVRAGGDPLAHASRLGQTVVQVADNLGHALGDHLLTVGVEGAWLGIRRRYLPGSLGIWRFGSLDGLAANQPESFERLVLLDGADPDVTLSVLQAAAYAQDEWSVRDHLTLSFGLRADWPVALSRPGYNRAAEIRTGVVTDRLQIASPLVSPRIGLNWSPPGRWRTQVRGGIGVFTGTPPLAWIADAYANTGLRTAFLACAGGATPTFEPGDVPAACADGAGPDTRDLTFLADDFRYPQDLRASIAVDRELPWGLVATLEALYTRALHQVELEDLNLGPALEGEPSPDEGYPRDTGDRPVFGTPRLVPDRFGPFDPGRRWDGYGRVIRVGSRSRNAALALAGEVQRRFSDRLDLRIAYTYTRAVDTRSLLYPDAALNYGLTPVGGDPARPEVAPSAFGRPHRVVASAWARLADWGDGLDATLLYTGQSGLPYSYVYETDMNGDGYPGPGALETAYNDLLFVPAQPSDLDGTYMSRVLLIQLAALEPCLRDATRRIAPRNRCRTPWSNRLDLRLSQGLRLPFGAVRVRGDLMNVLNLLNSDWGLVYTAPPVVPVYRVDLRAGCPEIRCTIENPLVGWYSGPRRLNPETGLPVPELPHVLSLPESQWRAQLGLELALH